MGGKGSLFEMINKIDKLQTRLISKRQSCRDPLTNVHSNFICKS